ncbi:MAG: hypothetical protein NTW64_01820 [Candidatus Omnitrophica bacterium]|nr:hypothetical protein [Candidatus Omnitrophota bacterium]
MTKAIEIFNQLEKGILNIIKAADIYSLYILGSLRKELPSKDLIEDLIANPRVSLLAICGEAYKEEEIKILEQNEHLKKIGEQILLSSYTSYEIYMIEKFKEYYNNLLSDKDTEFIENSLQKLSFRSLKEIKNNYYDFLNIDLPSFEIDISTTEKCNFKPKNTWDALNLISKARNEIAHTGESKIYKIVTLVDSWDPFDFIRMWVNLFDVNFDLLIYEKRTTRLVGEYKARLANSIKMGPPRGRRYSRVRRSALCE